MLTLLTILLFFSSGSAEIFDGVSGDSLFIREKYDYSCNSHYVEKDEYGLEYEIERAVHRLNYFNIKKNVKKEDDGVFFYIGLSDSANVVFLKDLAKVRRDEYIFFSFENDSAYIVVDPFRTGIFEPEERFFHDCLMKISSQNIKKFQDYCSRRLPLSDELKKELKWFVENPDGFLTTYNSFNAFVLSFWNGDSVSSLRITVPYPEIGFLMRESYGKLYKEIAPYIGGLEKCQWKNFVENEAPFIRYIESHANARIKCPVR